MEFTEEEIDAATQSLFYYAQGVHADWSSTPEWVRDYHRAIVRNVLASIKDSRTPPGTVAG